MVSASNINSSLVSKSIAFVRQDRSWVGYLVGVTILLRCIWAFAIPVGPTSDAMAYDTFALNIVNHGVFGWTPDMPGAFWPVGTSAIYALFFFVFGHSYWPIVLFNIAVSAGIVVVTMRLAQRFFGVACANIAGTIVAVWPSLIFYVTVLASELPFTLLMLGAFDVWTNPKFTVRNSAIVSGVLLAGACYLRPVGLLLPFVLAISAVFYNGKWRAEAAKCLITVFVAALLIAPWTFRNYRVFGHPVLISTNGPITLWMGNHPGTDGSHAKLPEWTSGMDDYTRAKELGKIAEDYIVSDPFAFVKRSVYKVIKQHSYETIAVTWNAEGISSRFGAWALTPLKGITDSYWLAVLAVSVLGLFLLFRAIGFLAVVFHPMVMPWIYVSGIHAVFVAQDRYHFAAAPFIAMLAAYAIGRLALRLENGPEYESQ